MNNRREFNPDQLLHLDTVKSLLSVISMLSLLPGVGTLAKVALDFINKVLPVPVPPVPVDVVDNAKDLNPTELLNLQTVKVLTNSIALASPLPSIKCLAQQAVKLLDSVLPVPPLPPIPVDTYAVDLTGVAEGAQQAAPDVPMAS